MLSHHRILEQSGAEGDYRFMDMISEHLWQLASGKRAALAGEYQFIDAVQNITGKSSRGKAAPADE
jgi:hypothetical protein